MIRAWWIAGAVVYLGLGAIGFIAFLLGYENIEAAVWQIEKSLLSLLMMVAVSWRTMVWAGIIRSSPMTEPTSQQVQR